MKKSTEILGMILALVLAIGSIFKANHYPGGSFFLSLGLGVLFLPFLILLAIDTYKEKKRPGPISAICASALIYLIGFLFLILHWPGGRFLAFTGLVLLLISLLVLCINEFFKEPEKRMFSIINISLIAIGASLIYIASFRSDSKDVFNGYITINENMVKTNQIFTTVNKSYYDSLAGTNPVYSDLQQKTSALVNLIEDIKTELTSRAGGDRSSANPRSIKQYDNVDIPAQLLIAQGKGQKIKEEINKYKEFILTNNRIFHSSEIIENLLDTQVSAPSRGEVNSWVDSKFNHIPVVCVISVLSGLQSNILSCEFVVLSQKN